MSGLTVDFSLPHRGLRSRGWIALAGTRLDPFGRAKVRRVERALIAEYRALIERAVTLAALPGLIRGYEDVKLTSVARFREAVLALGF